MIDCRLFNWWNLRNALSRNFIKGKEWSELSEKSCSDLWNVWRLIWLWLRTRMIHDKKVSTWKCAYCLSINKNRKSSKYFSESLYKIMSLWKNRPILPFVQSGNPIKWTPYSRKNKRKLMRFWDALIFERWLFKISMNF